jgi:hypothetical protein
MIFNLFCRKEDLILIFFVLFCVAFVFYYHFRHLHGLHLNAALAGRRPVFLLDVMPWFLGKKVVVSYLSVLVDGDWREHVDFFSVQLVDANDDLTRWNVRQGKVFHNPCLENYIRDDTDHLRRTMGIDYDIIEEHSFRVTLTSCFWFTIIFADQYGWLIAAVLQKPIFSLCYLLRVHILESFFVRPKYFFILLFLHFTQEYSLCNFIVITLLYYGCIVYILLIFFYFF